MPRHPIMRTLGLIAGYILCFSSVRLVALTFITYTVSYNATPDRPGGLQRIGDILQANLSLTYGAAAFIFILILQALYPLTRTQLKTVINLRDLRDCFTPNALNGLILTVVLVMGTSLGGYMNYLGIYMKFDEVLLSISSSIIFGIGLFMLILVEEYILRVVVEPLVEPMGGSDHVFASSLLSSAVFLLFKFLQFDLSWIQVINLILFNLTLSMIARNERTFMASTSFGGTFLILVHVFFGLPFMEQDMPGILLLRGASDEGLGSLLSGGSVGPEAGLVLTVLLVIYLYLPQVRSKKIEV